MTEKTPDFSEMAESYATYRPGYPAELFDWLAAQVREHRRAWDTATGNGQAARGLADHFEQVVATDRSEAQLRQAPAHPRVEYRVARAEESGLPDESIDLVVSAAALHWFDLSRFYTEARRVLRTGGVLAAWTYHVAHIEPPLDAVFGSFYRDVVGSYFAEGARLVDDRYRGIRLPGQALATPAFSVTAKWNAEEILRFVTTWSGVQAYREATGKDPIAELAPAVHELCGTPDARLVLRWPLYLHASRL